VTGDTATDSTTATDEQGPDEHGEVQLDVSKESGLVKMGWRLFQWRSGTPVPLLLAIGFWWWGVAWPLWSVIAGLSCIVVGEFFRFWGVMHAGILTRTRKKKLRTLITSGPFRRMRNPLYVGNILLGAGAGLLSGIWWLGPIAAVFGFIQYTFIVRYEERLLETAFGQEYRDYMAGVPRWLPGLTPYAKVSEQESGFRRGYRSEKSTFFAIFGLLLFVTIKFVISIGAVTVHWDRIWTSLGL
jgi:protein-S-isoprenylcysteine O-methyltransferase Ste14